MSPKFYGLLWIVCAISAGILWLAGVFTLTTLVVYGFIGFGLVFTGMMCVLPGMVVHPRSTETKTTLLQTTRGTPDTPYRVAAGHPSFPIGLRSN